MTVQTGNIAGVALAEQTLESWNRVSFQSLESMFSTPKIEQTCR